MHIYLYMCTSCVCVRADGYSGSMLSAGPEQTFSFALLRIFRVVLVVPAASILTMFAVNLYFLKYLYNKIIIELLQILGVK